MRERVYTAAAWLVVVGVVAATLRRVYQTWGTSQPVAFNHQKHVGFGIACEACHVGAKDAARATIPNVQTCALCHIPGKDNPPTPARLEAYLQEMKEIPWKEIYKAPQHVRFSHKRHVELAGLDCKACHGDIAGMERAVVRQPVALKMENCLACHRRENVTTDCLACHR
ncbi:MAG: cytochrome c3 family protein [Elusimicrobia bacterium]|nr:cytochrome c3 family protein [Elusimicrobiota bacterium]